MTPLEEMGRFKAVVIDPPWDIKFGGGKTREENRQLVYANRERGDYGHGWGIRQLEYESMTVEEISKMPILSVCDDDAFVFMWTTQGHLPQSFAILESWGLSYCSTMVWHKPFGVQPWNRPQYNGEFILLGRNGSPEFTDAKAFMAVNTWANPRVHSTKPEGFYDLLRRVTPGPRLDIFGRRRIAGFESWGNEAPEGPALPDHYQQVLLEA